MAARIQSLSDPQELSGAISAVEGMLRKVGDGGSGLFILILQGTRQAGMESTILGNCIYD